MLKNGMIIGDRYEILEKIGTGGMSDVYKAKCHKLNRLVAIKVLKQEFSENSSFVAKFRIEAQAAAGLVHPNIVNVYDVGEENGIYYIVMELVEGITLKNYIEKKVIIQYKEAVSIAIQVSLGIEAAHKNNIIHRDIKPQNIIISREGKVKVTDFGIAKAATSNTITSNVMGSVHYTSPEQARGGYSDEKSDIYSMGITLFEMLTGRVPFNGDTTVAIAIKHIQEPMPSPGVYNEDIPGSVEQIVLKCCEKSPDKRYQSMEELIEDLKRSLVDPEGDFVVRIGEDPKSPTKFISKEEREEIRKQTDRGELSKKDSHGTRRKMSGYEAEEDEDRAYEDEGYEEEEYEDDEEQENSKFERITAFLTIAAGVIICGVIIFFVGKITGFFGDGRGNIPGDVITDESSTQGNTLKMMEVKGKSLAEVQKALKEPGIEIKLVYQESEEFEQNIVIDSDVLPGATLQSGDSVTLTVSSGKEGREVPNVVGEEYEKAVGKLADRAFTVNKTESYDDEVEEGYIITQNPEGGQKVPMGSTVIVEVSKGKKEDLVLVPNVMGIEEDEAVVKLIENGLEVGNTQETTSDTYEEGLVCYQSYSVNQKVPRGTKVDIQISTGEKNATYKFNASIAAPSTEEAPDFVSGTSVNVTLVADNGKVLMNTNTTTFPIQANYYGISASKGTITFVYTIMTPTTSTTNEKGETVSVPGKKETRTFTRTVEFIQE